MSPTPKMEVPQLVVGKDNDDSLCDDDVDSSACDQTLTNTEERDEVKEVQRMAQTDTRHVVIWRLIVSTSLLLTAVAVTATTYFFLIEEQQNNFQTAVSDMSNSNCLSPI